jgi:hypothetical protein
VSGSENPICLDHLWVLAGEWELEVGVPGGSREVIQRVRTNFEWLYDQYLVQRTGPPEAQKMEAFITLNQERQVFEQYHWDSGGVVRVYEMTIRNDLWTLSRTEIEFLPLDLAERFIGRFADDGNSIHALWEVSPDGKSWQPEYEVVYRKL